MLDKTPETVVPPGTCRAAWFLAGQEVVQHVIEESVQLHALPLQMAEAGEYGGILRNDPLRNHRYRWTSRSWLKTARRILARRNYGDAAAQMKVMYWCWPLGRNKLVTYRPNGLQGRLLQTRRVMNSRMMLFSQSNTDATRLSLERFFSTLNLEIADVIQCADVEFQER